MSLLDRLALALTLAATLAFSQINVGRISGAVSDSSGAAIADCAVEAIDAAGLKQTVRTESSGFYVFPSLPFGIYEVRVEQPGFRSSREIGLTLDAASQRTVNFRLEVGQVTDSVEVSATAEQVQATSGNLGREYTRLLRLSPGVVATALNVFNPQLALNQQNINGIRTQSSYFLVDGAENHDNGANSNGIVDPNIGAIAEVKMETSSYAAEFGGRAGAIVNLVTKSGTKDFHGTLFEFVRNDAFDARSFFSAKVDSLRFNDFGGTVGGPVFVPGKFNRNRDKLFFFYVEEFESRVRRVVHQEERVCLVILKTGNFRDLRSRHGQHLAGEAPAGLCRRLREEFGEQAGIGRWSDDTFMVTLLSTKQDALKRIRDLSHRVAAPYICVEEGQRHTLRLKIDIGIADLHAIENSDRFLAKADSLQQSMG